MTEHAKTPVSEVHNLATGETYIYTLTPDEALISAHMEAMGLVSQITIPDAREKVRALIQEGKQSLAIGDLAVRKSSAPQLKHASNDESFIKDMSERPDGLTDEEAWALVHRLSRVLSDLDDSQLPATHQVVFDQAKRLLAGETTDGQGQSLCTEQVAQDLDDLDWDGVVPEQLIEATRLVLPGLQLPEPNMRFSTARRESPGK